MVTAPWLRRPWTLAGLPALLLVVVSGCRSASPGPAGATPSAAGPYLRCLFRLPVAACEAAGVAAFDEHVAISVAASATAREYCGGDQPTPGLRSGFLVLERGTGRPLLDSPLPLEGGFGGAERDDDEHLWQSLYSEGVVVRARIIPDDPAASGVVSTVPIPHHGRIGGLAFDGTRLWGHNADEDRLYVIDPATGTLERTLVPPHPRAVNGIAWTGGRLYAALNDDAAGPSSDGSGEVPEAIIRMDPATGAEIARWRLPPGLYPHSMDAGGPQSLVILMQNGLDARRQAELWELALPSGGDAGADDLPVLPCRAEDLE